MRQERTLARGREPDIQRRCPCGWTSSSSCGTWRRFNAWTLLPVKVGIAIHPQVNFERDPSVNRERWWADAPRERFWLESTDRDDLGVDLRAPLHDDSGNENWRYTLFREASPATSCFTMTNASQRSPRPRVSPVLAPVVWAARGSCARERGAQPTTLPGCRIALADHRLRSPEDLLAAAPGPLLTSGASGSGRFDFATAALLEWAFLGRW